MPNLNPYPLYQKYFRNPKTKLIVIIATILYIVSPIDIIPEFLTPVLGVGILDDGVVIVMFVLEILNWISSKDNKNTETRENK